MNHFTIVIPSYNNIKWIEKCIDSAIHQNYKNFDVIYIDAESNDGSYELVKEKYSHKINIVRNNSRKYQTENFLTGVKMAKKGSIIVTLDGDDWLKDNNVLNTLNGIYDDNVWMTYGSYQNDDGSRGIMGSYSENTINNNSFRQDNWYASHLRTFRRELFLSIKDEDLRDDNGEYYRMTGDLVIQFPMLEMSGCRSKHIDEVLYVYNRQNPLSDDKVDRDLQSGLDVILRNKKPYARLEKLI